MYKNVLNRSKLYNLIIHVTSAGTMQETAAEGTELVNSKQWKMNEQEKLKPPVKPPRAKKQG